MIACASPILSNTNLTSMFQATKNNVDEGIAESAATVLLSEDLNTNMERTQNNSGTDEYVEATESVQKTENVATDKGEEANVDSTE